MLKDYFYHSTIKTITYGFGTLFNNIYLQKLNDSGEVTSLIKVPIRYGPTQKFLARLKQSPEDLNNPLEITLPRMSFEITSLLYDSRRKATSTTSFLVADANGQNIRKSYVPVPYQIGYNLYIMTKLIDDVWQITEQILPYFTPSHTLTFNLLPAINEKRDVAYTLNSTDINEDYEGDFSERVTYIYTLSFTADAMFFKGLDTTSTSGENIIERVSIGFLSGERNGLATRDLTYSIGPKAIKNYGNNVVTTLDQDVSLVQFNIKVTDSTNISKGDLITIDLETMRVLDVDNTSNILTVRRGDYNTSITKHVLGSEVKVITLSDDSLIPFGDEFGISDPQFV